jgi:integral membrane protein (TIGR01906 family)
MHNHWLTSPFLQALSLCCIAAWWIVFLSWQPGTVRLMETFSYRFEPPQVSVETVSRATTRALEYVAKGTPRQADVFFTKDEVSHLDDVFFIFRIVRISISVAAFFGWGILIASIHAHGSLSPAAYRRARSILLGVALFTILCLFSFSSFFVAFHRIFFPQGNWEFPDNSLLIQLFPLTFWKVEVGGVLCGGIVFALLFHILGLSYISDEKQ